MWSLIPNSQIKLKSATAHAHKQILSPMWWYLWSARCLYKYVKGLICQYFQTPKCQNTVCKWKINILDNHFKKFFFKKGKTKHEKLVVKHGLFWPLWARFRKQDSEHPNRTDLSWRHWVESVDLAVYWHPVHSARYWNCVQHTSDRKKKKKKKKKRRRHFEDRISSFPGKMPRNCVVGNCYNTLDNHNLIHDLVLKMQIRLGPWCVWNVTMYQIGVSTTSTAVCCDAAMQ